MIGVIGIIVLLMIAIGLSTNPRAINPRVVISALVLQIGLGAFVLYLPWGQAILATLSGYVQAVIDYSNTGISFLFGDLASDKLGFVFAVRVLPVIIFISAITSVLYHLNIMQWIVYWFGKGLSYLLGVSRVESLVAITNIFLDQTQSSLVVKPYVNKLTKAQFFTVMCSGLASISGAVLAGYASLGVNLNYLIAASFMAAPGGLLMAKLLMPSEDAASNNEEIFISHKSKASNVVEAAANGAAEGLKLAANIGAMLLAFVAIIAMLNALFGGVGQLIGLPSLSLDLILGYAFSPLMYLLGVPWQEAELAGNLIGQKIILNEFVAFANFIELQTGQALSPHSEAVVTFALCGFANLGSLAILLGGLGSIVPERKSEIAQMGYRVILAGTLSNLMSAAIASILL